MPWAFYFRKMTVGFYPYIEFKKAGAVSWNN
jgi:hypothetical protein